MLRKILKCKDSMVSNNVGPNCRGGNGKSGIGDAVRPSGATEGQRFLNTLGVGEGNNDRNQ